MTPPRGATIDGVLATNTYVEVERLRRELTRLGFRQAAGDTGHVHRWIGPSGIPFDLVPAGEHLGGTGNPWDLIAIETALTLRIRAGVTIRHVSAAAFLAQKWAAHHDRGRADPLNSHDLEDILALLASRPSLLEEMAAAPREVQEYVAEQAKDFLGHPNAEDLLAAHLNNSQDPAATAAGVKAVLGRLAAEARG